MCYKVLVKLIYETKIETHIQCQVHWVALNKCPFSPVNVFIARCDFFVSLGELLAQRHSSSKLLQNLFLVPLFDTSHILSYCAMAPHSNTLAWKIPGTEEPGRLQSKELGTTERLHFHFPLSCIVEGNGNPLQCSCLENPRDGGAWWAAVYGVAQSRTRLKRLSSSSSSSFLLTRW